MPCTKTEYKPSTNMAEGECYYMPPTFSRRPRHFIMCNIFKEVLLLITIAYMGRRSDMTIYFFIHGLR